MNHDEIEAAICHSADAIHGADALLLAAGAGMGVDSGLPDFRGNEGFWKAYPPLARRNLSFVDLANPVWFRRDPQQAWGFYGHRLNLYRTTRPHAGYQTLLAWGKGKPGGYFVFTSNVDGHFERAGFAPDRIVECHGSIHHLQCSTPCHDDIWDAEPLSVDVDETDPRARLPLPLCPQCGDVARPNVLMFGDRNWVERRADEQYRRYNQWRVQNAERRLVIIECGAGTAVSTVRYHCEQQPGMLIRINPREPSTPGDGISIPLGAGAAIGRLAALLGE